MLKMLLSAVAIAACLSAAPAFAQTQAEIPATTDQAGPAEPGYDAYAMRRHHWRHHRHHRYRRHHRHHGHHWGWYRHHHHGHHYGYYR
jgi:Ni/Co efflux regulator RcnB